VVSKAQRHNVSLKESKRQTQLMLPFQECVEPLVETHLEFTILLGRVTDLPNVGAIWDADCDNACVCRAVDELKQALCKSTLVSIDENEWWAMAVASFKYLQFIYDLQCICQYVSINAAAMSCSYVAWNLFSTKCASGTAWEQISCANVLLQKRFIHVGRINIFNSIIISQSVKALMNEERKIFCFALQDTD
jgi:hypothetical protein